MSRLPASLVPGWLGCHGNAKFLQFFRGPTDVSATPASRFQLHVNGVGIVDGFQMEWSLTRVDQDDTSKTLTSLDDEKWSEVERDMRPAVRGYLSGFSVFCKAGRSHAMGDLVE